MSKLMTEMEKEEVKLKLRQQLALFSTQELLTKMTEKCFKACIEKPGSKLSNHDQTCLAMCMDRFMDSWQIISNTYTNRLIRENNVRKGF